MTEQGQRFLHFPHKFKQCPGALGEGPGGGSDCETRQTGLVAEAQLECLGICVHPKPQLTNIQLQHQ